MTTSIARRSSRGRCRSTSPASSMRSMTRVRPLLLARILLASSFMRTGCSASSRLTRTSYQRSVIPASACNSASRMSINAYPHSRKTRQMNDTTRDELLRVEPHSRRVAGRMPVNGELSLGAGAGALWALQEGSPRGGFELHGPLLRIDPNTNRVTARIALRTPEGQPFAGYEVLADRDDVWVGGAGGALRVDPRTNRVTQAVAAPDELISSDFALARSGLWAITEDGRLLRFDTRTGTVIGDVRLAVADALELSGGPGDALLAT